MRKKTNYRLAPLLAALLLACEAARAQQAAPDEARVDHDTVGKANEDDIARESENPIGNLTVLPFENYTNFDVGPNKGTQNILEFEPVVPIHLNQYWNLINRAVIPVVWNPDLSPFPSVPQAFGPTDYSAFLSPRNLSGGWTVGASPIVQLPTATSPTVGSSVWGPGSNGTASALGVLADDKSNTLYVCSDDFSAAGITIPGGTATSLKLFDLKTGEPKGSIPTPGKATLCNDIVVATDGTAYVTDSFAGHILRLKPDAKEFEVWAHDPRWDVADKPELDGLAILPDGAIYANIFEGDGLYRIPVNADGSPGKITKLQTSRPLYHSDGLRAFGNKLIMVEGETKGNLDLISVDGDNAKIETIKDGFDGPVSLVQVGDTIYVLDAPLRYLLGPEAKEKKPPPPFKATAVPAPKQ